MNFVNHKKRIATIIHVDFNLCFWKMHNAKSVPKLFFTMNKQINQRIKKLKFFITNARRLFELNYNCDFLAEWQIDSVSIEWQHNAIVKHSDEVLSQHVRRSLAFDYNCDFLVEWQVDSVSIEWQHNATVKHSDEILSQHVRRSLELDYNCDFLAEWQADSVNIAWQHNATVRHNDEILSQHARRLFALS